MSGKRKSIAVDMDGVIADTVAQFILWYERDHQIKITREAFYGKPEIEVLPPGVMEKIVHCPGFFRTVPVIKNAQQALLTLSKNFDIYIVSAAMEFPNSLPEKYAWLHEHFPFISWRNIIFCGDKSVIAADYMIDDHVRNLDSFKGHPLLFTAGHNVAFQHHIRINNWKEALDFFSGELKS